MNAAQTDLVDGHASDQLPCHAVGGRHGVRGPRLHEAAERMAALSRELVEYKATTEVTYTGYGSWAGNCIEQLARPIARDLEQLQRDAAKLNGLEDILAHMVKPIEIGD